MVFGQGRQCQENDRWLLFRSHYGFDAFYCQPGIAGAHEKGGGKAKWAGSAAAGSRPCPAGCASGAGAVQLRLNRRTSALLVPDRMAPSTGQTRQLSNPLRRWHAAHTVNHH